VRVVAFGLHARLMGITDTASIAEKLAIWEGMWSDEEKGDINTTGVSVLLFIPQNGRKVLVDSKAN